MRIKRIIIALLCSIMLIGCGQSAAVEFTSMEEEPILSYEVPVSTPGILVNQLGYITGSTKEVIFVGREIPTLFHVVEAQSGEIVYTGYPEDKEYNETLGEYNSYGDFTEFQTPGTYYIEAPILGKSYTFTIDDSIYDTVLQEATRQYYYNRCGITLTKEYAGEAAHNACHMEKALLQEDTSISLNVTGGWHQDETGQKDVVIAARTISALLLSYELHEDVFTDDSGIPESGNGVPDILDEIKYEIEWLLKMQDPKTGAIYEGITVYTQNNTVQGKTVDSYIKPSSVEAEKAFAMALAKFSYLYQSYDTEYATNCLKAADRAWKHMELNETKQTVDSLKFAAATELYRASGQNNFHNYIIEYLQSEEYRKELNEIELIGCVTYISTKHTVNVELCSKVVKTLMSQAEDIAKTAKQSVYLTAGNANQDNSDQLLLEMMYLSVVNHIISNHEYETVIENHLHYLLGRNGKAVSYIDYEGEENYENVDNSVNIMKQFEADSEFIFMLSGIIESYQR